MNVLKLEQWMTFTFALRSSVSFLVFGILSGIHRVSDFSPILILLWGYVTDNASWIALTLKQLWRVEIPHSSLYMGAYVVSANCLREGL